jgi:arylsulfatase A-like enzyme
MSITPVLLRTCWLVLFAASTLGLSAQAPSPNVVFILVDDLGWRDLGCYGSTFYETPHCDRLAREGMRFTQAYAASPVCSPTRASLLSGLHPVRTGITDYIDVSGANQPEQWGRNTPLLPAPYTDRLALDVQTLPEYLQAADYATFFAGKWHLGDQGWYPEDQGFDVNRGGIEKGGPYGGDRYFSPYDNPRLADGPPGEHLPARLAQETVDFMAAHREQPFLAYLSFYSVHTPLMARPDLEAKYEAKRQVLGLQNAWGQVGENQMRLVQEHAIYAAMVEAMDQAVGQVLDGLDSLGLADNTLVVFFSDNGGLATSEGHPTSNLPLRAGKGWLYEGGIREPLILRWPGRVPALSLCETPVISHDLLPTMLAAVGLTEDQAAPLDGVNLGPLLGGQSAWPARDLFWHYPHYGNQGGAPGAAIRRGDHKLIRWFGVDGQDRYELFDLSQDLAETRDLSQADPQRVADLAAALDQWLQSTEARFPSRNPAYEAVPADE